MIDNGQPLALGLATATAHFRPLVNGAAGLSPILSKHRRARGRPDHAGPAYVCRRQRAGRPVRAALIGSRFYCQLQVADPAANSLGLVTSQGAVARIGIP